MLPESPVAANGVEARLNKFEDVGKPTAFKAKSLPTLLELQQESQAAADKANAREDALMRRRE